MDILVHRWPRKLPEYLHICMWKCEPLDITTSAQVLVQSLHPGFLFTNAQNKTVAGSCKERYSTFGQHQKKKEIPGPKYILILYISPSKLALATDKKFEKNIFNTSYWITINFLLIGLCSCCGKFFWDIFTKTNKDKSTSPSHEEMLSTWNWRKFFTHSKHNQSLFSTLLKHSSCKYLNMVHFIHCGYAVNTSTDV